MSADDVRDQRIAALEADAVTRAEFDELKARLVSLEQRVAKLPKHAPRDLGGKR